MAREECHRLVGELTIRTAAIHHDLFARGQFAQAVTELRNRYGEGTWDVSATGSLARLTDLRTVRLRIPEVALPEAGH
jgi:hypothetical protein